MNIIGKMIENCEKEEEEKKEYISPDVSKPMEVSGEPGVPYQYTISMDEYMGKEKPPEDEALIIIQDGGLGDCICCTPMLESARQKYPNRKIVFASFYTDIFHNNPNIDFLYSTNSFGDMFENWISKIKYNSSLLKKDIYNSGLHKLFPGKLSEAYCYYYDLPYPGDNVKVYLTEGEEEEAHKFLNSFTKGVVLIHPCAGKVNYDPKRKLTPNKDWFVDDWKKLVSMLTKEFDVVQIGGAHEEPIEGVTTYLMGVTSVRQTMALVKNSLSFISVDSFIGHVGAGVGKSGVVMFGRSNPNIFSHDSNVNVWVDNSCKLNDMFCGRPQSYWGDVELFQGRMRNWECPHRSCMKAITPEMVYKKLFEAIERNTR